MEKKERRGQERVQKGRIKDLNQIERKRKSGIMTKK